MCIWKKETDLPYNLTVPLVRVYVEETRFSKTYAAEHALQWCISNRQDMGRVGEHSVHGLMNGEEKAMCVHSEIWLTEKKEVMPFAGTSVNEGKMKVPVAQPTLWDPMDGSPPGSSVRGILLARIREWVAIPFSRGSSWPRDWTQVSCIAGEFFTVWATRKI